MVMHAVTGFVAVTERGCSSIVRYGAVARVVGSSSTVSEAGKVAGEVTVSP